MTLIKLCDVLLERYPKMELVVIDNVGVQATCRVDGRRCLNTRDPSDDYSLIGNPEKGFTVLRVLTSYSEKCDGCDRNL